MDDVSLNAAANETSAAPVTENTANTASTPQNVGNAQDAGGSGLSPSPADGRENGTQGEKAQSLSPLGTEKPLTEAQKEDFSPDWRAQLPEVMRELAKDFESREAFMDAAKRGAAYKPALKPEELEYAPQGVEMDATAARQFRELGVKIGLTAEQAKALVDFEAEAVAERARRNAEEGLAFLKQQWGAEYENNVQHAKRALLALDNKTDGRISRLFGKDGLGSVPSLMEAFALIGKDMAEDSAAGAKSTAGSGRESALGMFAGMFH